MRKYLKELFWAIIIAFTCSITPWWVVGFRCRFSEGVGHACQLVAGQNRALHLGADALILDDLVSNLTELQRLGRC